MTTILNLAYGFKVKVINYDFKKEFEVMVRFYKVDTYVNETH